MTLRKKICSATIFFCIIAHVLLGYFTKKYTDSNDGYYFGFLFYILVFAMPFLVGLKKIHISYEFAITVIYVTVCLSLHLATKGSVVIWHPGWLIFLTIPIYHIFKTIPTRDRRDYRRDDRDYYDSNDRRY